MAGFLHIYTSKMCQIVEMCPKCLTLDPKCTEIPLLKLINHGLKFINHHGWKVSHCHESILEFFTAVRIFLAVLTRSLVVIPKGMSTVQQLVVDLQPSF